MDATSYGHGGFSDRLSVLVGSTMVILEMQKMHVISERYKRERSPALTSDLRTHCISLFSALVFAAGLSHLLSDLAGPAFDHHVRSHLCRLVRQETAVGSILSCDHRLSSFRL